MRKKRVLFVSEASWKSTGYSVYTKEILSRLCQMQDLEVAELACYATADDPMVGQLPWKVYPNRPSNGSPELEQYRNRPSSIFGEQTFLECSGNMILQMEITQEKKKTTN